MSQSWQLLESLDHEEESESGNLSYILDSGLLFGNRGGRELLSFVAAILCSFSFIIFLFLSLRLMLYLHDFGVDDSYENYF